MTLEEYEKVLEEKRKALQALKAEERKVEMDKDLKKMQLLSSKKTNDEIFAKLVSWRSTEKFHLILQYPIDFSFSSFRVLTRISEKRWPTRMRKPKRFDFLDCYD